MDPALDEGDVTLLEQVGEPVYTPDQTESDVVGSGGVYTFTFKAVAEGEAAVKLVYSRAWNLWSRSRPMSDGDNRVGERKVRARTAPASFNLQAYSPRNEAGLAMNSRYSR